MRGLVRQIRKSNGAKKTRQGQSKNTKYGTPVSKKYYKKPHNGSGQGR